ncbi:MAG: hypothetical protein ACLUGV_07665 [Alistipes shahii]
MSNKEIEKANQADKRYKAGSNAFQDIPTENHAQNHPYKVHPPQVKPCYGRHYLCSQFYAGWKVDRFSFPIIFSAVLITSDFFYAVTEPV